MVTNYIFFAQRTRWLAAVTISVAFVNIPLTYVLIKVNGGVGAAQAMAISFGLSFLLHLVRQQPRLPNAVVPATLGPRRHRDPDRGRPGLVLRAGRQRGGRRRAGRPAPGLGRLHELHRARLTGRAWQVMRSTRGHCSAPWAQLAATGASCPSTHSGSVPLTCARTTLSSAARPPSPRQCAPEPDARHVAYIHAPMRYAWTSRATWPAPASRSRPRIAAQTLRPLLRRWDVATSRRPDVLVANSAARGGADPPVLASRGRGHPSAGGRRTGPTRVAGRRIPPGRGSSPRLSPSRPGRGGGEPPRSSPGHRRGRSGARPAEGHGWTDGEVRRVESHERDSATSWARRTPISSRVRRTSGWRRWKPWRRERPSSHSGRAERSKR